MAQQVAVFGLALGLGICGFLLVQRKLSWRQRKKKPEIPPDHRAFVQRFQISPPPHPPPPAAPPPLTGKTFAVKDIFDVQGYITGFGNPTWAATHDPAARTAACVQAVIEKGATLEGKTHMDDMAYSILGTSSLLGEPVNPLAPEHFPGGSSGGSAVAVAAGVVDFALGTDTAGSIRVPAANCGVLGYRPTHGTVNSTGVIPMSPSLDTVGIVTQDVELLHRVGHILLNQPIMSKRPPQKVLVADDLFDLSKCPRPPVTETLIGVTEKYLGPVVKYLKVGNLLSKKVPSLAFFVPGSSQNGSSPSLTAQNALPALAEAQKLLQRLEFRENHGAWVATHLPVLHDHVAPRVRAAAEGVLLEPATSTDPQESAASEPEQGAAADGEGSDALLGERKTEETRAKVVETELEKGLRRAALKVKEELKLALNEELKNDVLLALPAVPDLPLRKDAPAQALDEYRSKAMQILSLSSMSGLPQVVIPIGREPGKGKDRGGLPLSLSFMARSGADRFLLDSTLLYAPVLPLAYIEYMATKRPKSSPLESEASKASTSGATRDPKAQNGQHDQKSAAEVVKEQGNEAFKQGKYDKAVELYSRAIELDPKNPNYYSNRAMAYINLSLFDLAEADCTTALGLDKKNVKAFLRRGTAREFVGMYQEAYKDFETALILEPKNKTAMDGMRRIENAGFYP